GLLVIGFPHLMPAAPFDEAVVAIDEESLGFVTFAMEADQFQGAARGIWAVIRVVCGDLVLGRKKICLYRHLTVLVFGRYADGFRVVCHGERMTHWVVGFDAVAVDCDRHLLPASSLAFEEAVEHQCKMAFQEHYFGRI